MIISRRTNLSSDDTHSLDQARPRSGPNWSLTLLAGTGLALTLALGGCGETAPPLVSGASPSQNTGVTDWDVNEMPDPCRTLTASQVSRIVRQSVSAGARQDSWPPLCRFALASGIMVFVSDNSEPTGIQEYEQLEGSGQPLTQVSGLGDRAYWVPDASTLHVLIGKTHLKVLFATGKSPDGQAKTQAEALARLAIQHL